jgi:hypothetical protein
VHSTKPSVKHLHRERRRASKPEVVLNTNIKQVFILAVIELIEDRLAVFPIFPSFADVLETVSIEI